MPFKKHYKIVLTTSGVDYKASGKTISEAIGKLGLSWEQIKAKGVIKISQGEKTDEHVFVLKILRRIFANKLTRMMWGKRLELLFKSK